MSDALESHVQNVRNRAKAIFETVNGADRRESWEFQLAQMKLLGLIAEKVGASADAAEAMRDLFLFVRAEMPISPKGDPS